MGSGSFDWGICLCVAAFLLCIPGSQALIERLTAKRRRTQPKQSASPR
jgi:hypothetical protein